MPAKTRWRLAAVAALFLALFAVGRFTGLMDQIHPEAIRSAVEEAGAWGIAIFFAAFCVGNLLHVPGTIFAVAGYLAFGKIAGSAISFASGVAAVSITFVVVRAVGGRALTSAKTPFVQKMLARLEARPLTTLIILRSVLWWSPSLTYALALTDVRFRTHFLGAVIGLVAPTVLVTLGADFVLL